MLNQQKIGTFIAELRKEQNLTQKELAEKLSISDKAVSKWETGRSLPDNAILMELCAVLTINVNELLSGERLTDEVYEEKAEENMQELLDENEIQRNDRKSEIISFVCGGALLLLLIAFSTLSTGTGFALYIDLPSLIFLLLGTIVVLLLAGRLKDFFIAFPLAFGKQKEDTPPETYLNALSALRLYRKAVLPICLFELINAFIVILWQLDDMSLLGPSLGVALLTPFYGIILYFIVLPMEEKLRARL